MARLSTGGRGSRNHAIRYTFGSRPSSVRSFWYRARRSRARVGRPFDDLFPQYMRVTVHLSVQTSALCGVHAYRGLRPIRAPRRYTVLPAVVPVKVKGSPGPGGNAGDCIVVRVVEDIINSQLTPYHEFLEVCGTRGVPGGENFTGYVNGRYLSVMEVRAQVRTHSSCRVVPGIRVVVKTVHQDFLEPGIRVRCTPGKKRCRSHTPVRRKRRLRLPYLAMRVRISIRSEDSGFDWPADPVTADNPHNLGEGRGGVHLFW